jgi:hypothetical protein
MKKWSLSLFSLCFLCGSAFGEETASELSEADDFFFTLPPIIRYGTPVDMLRKDPILLEKQQVLDPKRGQLGVIESLSRQGLLGSEPSGTGGFSQFRGLGRSVDETSIQTLGVPLNPPQGLGLDLSVFPNFLWQSATFSLDASRSGFDPRGVAGTLHLTPWSAEALREKGEIYHFGQFFSSENTAQYFAAAKPSDQIAFVLGHSAGKGNGPAGAFSGNWEVTPTSFFSAHLLAVNYSAKVPGRLSAPTPDAQQQSVRVIPFLQWDQIIHSTNWKSAFFLDKASYRYDETLKASAADSEINSLQYGWENALTQGPWSAGFSVRRAQYETQSTASTGEVSSHLYGSYLFEKGSWAVEPRLFASHLLGMELSPGGSFGVVYFLDASSNILHERKIFSRISRTARFPTLSERYSQWVGAQGNPDLLPEKAWVSVLGYDQKGRRFSQSFQIQTQYRDEMIFFSSQNGTWKNQGNGIGLGALYQIEQSLGEGWMLRPSVNGFYSEIFDRGTPFPFQPPILAAIELEWKGKEELRFLSALMRFRGQAATQDPSEMKLPGWSMWDLELYSQVPSGWIASGNRFFLSFLVKNIFNRKVELTRDYPALGRTWGVALNLQI